MPPKKSSSARAKSAPVKSSAKKNQARPSTSKAASANKKTAAKPALKAAQQAPKGHHESLLSDKKLSRNPAEIFNLVRYLESEKVEEFEYAEGDFSISLKRNASGHGENGSRADGAALLEMLMKSGIPAGPAAGPAAAPAPAAAPVKEAPPAEAEDESMYKFIESPITGTFYSAPSPTAPPYVTAGQKVRKGQVVCIVEAMKLMNEIKSEFDGTVHRVCFENAKPVQAKQRLFYIIPE